MFLLKGVRNVQPGLPGRLFVVSGALYENMRFCAARDRHAICCAGSLGIN
jgi:hypothetical protein